MADDDRRQALRHRVRVFVDFWNYTLTMQTADPAFRTDWSQLGPVLARAAAESVDAGALGEYQGLGFYGSYDPTSERKLHRWATTKVATFPGVSVSIVPRQRKRYPPRCPKCHAAVSVCPACQADMRGTEEKGVDVRIATDMIRFAWLDVYDIAVLVSADRDFVALVDFLNARGIKVIHGTFPPRGADLTGHCWGSIDIPSLREQFRLN